MTNNIRQLKNNIPAPASLDVENDTFKADRETALHLLRSCFAAEISCFAEISRYLRDDSSSSRELLENILEMEQTHAAELAGMLQLHRLASQSRRLRGAPRASSESRLRRVGAL